MAEPFLGEIRIFAGNFAPTGWFLCQGQLLPINQYAALFSLLGTTYGGNGTNNFALPDLRGRVVVGMGNGAGLTPRVEGEISGAENNTLLASQLPAHSHALVGTSATGATDNPANALLASGSGTPIYNSSSGPVSLAANSIGATGGGQAVNNMQPYLVINYIIAFQGIFPSRN
ncbi:MAG: tail fiber protein [Methylomonas sp.]|jgi:microcystin-dependent protein